MDNRGISIIEAVVAVLILSMTMITIQTLNIYNIKSDQLNTSQVVADNLAREGIEAVRNLRDSNWQKYSGNIRSNNADGSGDHWNDGFDGTDSFGFNYSPQINNSSFNAVTSPENIQYYFIPELTFDSNDPNEQYTWNLRFADSVNTFDEADSVLATIITNENTGIYQVHLDPNTLMYIQADGIDIVQYPQTNFYRVVEITYEESYDDYLCVPGTISTCKLNAHDNIISIRSIVAWKDINNTVKHTTINSQLTDWYQRIDKQ